MIVSSHTLYDGESIRDSRESSHQRGGGRRPRRVFGGLMGWEKNMDILSPIKKIELMEG